MLNIVIEQACGPWRDGERGRLPCHLHTTAWSWAPPTWRHWLANPWCTHHYGQHRWSRLPSDAQLHKSLKPEDGETLRHLRQKLAMLGARIESWVPHIGDDLELELVGICGSGGMTFDIFSDNRVLAGPHRRGFGSHEVWRHLGVTVSLHHWLSIQNVRNLSQDYFELGNKSQHFLDPLNRPFHPVSKNTHF